MVDYSWKGGNMVKSHYSELAKKRINTSYKGIDSIVGVAKELGITRQHINMIERGNARPSVALAKKMAKFYGVDWTYFFGQ